MDLNRKVHAPKGSERASFGRKASPKGLPKGYRLLAESKHFGRKGLRKPKGVPFQTLSEPLSVFGSCSHICIFSKSGLQSAPEWMRIFENWVNPMWSTVRGYPKEETCTKILVGWVYLTPSESKGRAYEKLREPNYYVKMVRKSGPKGLRKGPERGLHVFASPIVSKYSLRLQ